MIPSSFFVPDPDPLMIVSDDTNLIQRLYLPKCWLNVYLTENSLYSKVSTPYFSWRWDTHITLGVVGTTETLTLFSGVTEWSSFHHKWSLVEYRHPNWREVSLWSVIKLLTVLTLISDSCYDLLPAMSVILTSESDAQCVLTWEAAS